MGIKSSPVPSIVLSASGTRGHLRTFKSRGHLKIFITRSIMSAAITLSTEIILFTRIVYRVGRTILEELYLEFVKKWKKIIEGKVERWSNIYFSTISLFL